MYVCALNGSVVSDSFRPFGLEPVRLLCPWDFSGKKYWSWLPFPSPGDLSDQGIKPVHCRQILDQLSHQGSPILCIGRCNSLSLVKPFLWYIHPNYLGPVFCSPSWISSGYTVVGRWVALVAKGLMASTSFVHWYSRWHSLSTDPCVNQQSPVKSNQQGVCVYIEGGLF